MQSKDERPRILATCLKARTPSDYDRASISFGGSANVNLVAFPVTVSGSAVNVANCTVAARIENYSAIFVKIVHQARRAQPWPNIDKKRIDRHVSRTSRCLIYRRRARNVLWREDLKVLFGTIPEGT